MEEPVLKKERAIQYNVYADEDRMRYFYFLKSKMMTPKGAAKAANVNYDTSRKWKQAYENDPDKNIPLRKTNRTSNRPVSRLNDEHKGRLVKFFDDSSLATIQDATDDLIKNFAGLNIKKSRVAEFMKEEYNLSIKGVSHHPKARNCDTTLLVRAVWVEEWTKKGMDFLKKCVFLDEFGFDVNMHRSKRLACSWLTSYR
jgi:transposase